MMSSLLQIGLLVISLSVTAGTGTDPYTEKRSESSVDVRLTLLSFSNLQDRKADGSRCDPQFLWTNLCDHLFKFCLKTPSSSECNLFETVKAGSGIVSPTINFENIELSEGHETSHQNVDWKNAVLTLTVDDEDGILGATENIDEFEYELIVWPLRSEEIRIEGKKLSESTLDTELMTKCSEYYYGEDCDVYCKPDKTTHTCNSTTGQRICSNGTDCRVWIPAATSRPTPETVQHTFDGDCSESVYIDPPVFANGTAHEAVTWITELKPTRELNITKCRNGDSYQYVINLISTDKNADLFIRIVKLSTPSCQSSNITISDVTGVLFSSSPDNCSKVIDSTPRIELTSASEKMRVVLSFSDIESLMKMQISTQTFAVDTSNKHYKKNLVPWHKPEIYTVGRNWTVPSFIIKLLNTTAKTEATTTTVKTSSTTVTTMQPTTTESRFKTFTESQFIRPNRNFTNEIDKLYFVGSWRLTLERYFKEDYTEKGYQVSSSLCVHAGEFLFKCAVVVEKPRTKRSILMYAGGVKIRARREIDMSKIGKLHELTTNTHNLTDILKSGVDNSTNSKIAKKVLDGNDTSLNVTNGGNVHAKPGQVRQVRCQALSAGEVKIRARREIDMRKIDKLHKLITNTHNLTDILKNGVDNSTNSTIVKKVLDGNDTSLNVTNGGNVHAKPGQVRQVRCQALRFPNHPKFTVPRTAQRMSKSNNILVQLQSTTLTATTQPTTKSTAQSETSPKFTRQWTTQSATQPATVQVTTKPATVTLLTTTQSTMQLTTTTKLTKPPISKSTFNPTTTKSTTTKSTTPKSTTTKSTTGPITSPKVEVKSRCKNRTTVVRLGKGEQYANVMLELSNHHIKMTLPPGEHNYEISSREQEERCHHKFMIYAWTGVVHSIQLQAEYQFDCTSLPSIAYSIIDASLLQHTKNLQRLCPGCHASQNQTLPVVKCLSNRLVVTWSTDLDQQQPFGDNPMKGLRRALLNYQESFPTSTILQLTILSTLPRVVSPMKDKSGLYITPVITASCLKNGQIYDSVNQICLQRLNHRPQAPSSELARY